MAEENGTRNGDSRITLAARLGTDSEWTPAPDRAPTTPHQEFPLRVADKPAHAGIEPPTGGDAPHNEPENPGSAAGLQAGLVAAEARARRLAAEVEVVQGDVRRALELAVVQAQQHAARSWRWREGRLRLLVPARVHQAATEWGVLSRLRAGRAERTDAGVVAHIGTRRRLIASILVVLALGAGAWGAGLAWTPKVENVVLDSGLEAPTTRWYPAGLRTEVSRHATIGRSGSSALKVRTSGINDGEGPAYSEVGSIRGGKHYTFSVFTRSFGGTVVYPEIRWKASDGSLLEASRGDPASLRESWKRLSVSGVAPADTASALLVVGEEAGTAAGVTYLIDDAQFERAETAGAYVATSGESGVIPGHLTNLAALLMLVLAGTLACLNLRLVVLLAIPLSLLVPPSITTLRSVLPDITPTGALVLASLCVLIMRGGLRAPTKRVIVPAVCYVAAVGVAFAIQPSIHAAGQGLAVTLGAWAAALLVLGVARRLTDLWVLLGALSTVAGAAAILAIVEAVTGQYLLDDVPGLVFRVLEREGAIRTQATFPHPIILGTFLALAAPLAIALLTRRPGWWRAGGLLAFSVIIGGLATTLSRGPWLAAIAALTTFVVLSDLRRRWLYLAAGFTALVLAAVMPVATPFRDAASGVVQRSDWNDRYIVDFRLQQARELASYGTEHPLSGSLDAGSRPSLVGVVEGREVEHSGTLDSIYGHELIQTGVLGLIAFLALILVVMGETFRGARRAHGELRILGSALAAAEVVVLVAGLFSNVLGFTQLGTAFWLVAGAGLCLRSMTNDASMAADGPAR